MNKVFVLQPNENWIVDRFVNEWNLDNGDISCHDPSSADVIWLLADWCWNQIPISLLKSKKVITTVHHIVPEKLGQRELFEFNIRDSVTDVYHVYNKFTYEFVKNLTKKPIHLIKYWANQNIWHQTNDKIDLRKKYLIPKNSFVIGSFQRDTEGHDLKSPKLEKGPDLLADFIENYSKTQNNVFVLLAGWRRQYIINRLNAKKIQFSYIEKPNQVTLNELYQCLDLYPVSARCEGGPQSLIECGLLNVPMISRNVGIANQLLPDYAINNDLLKAKPAIPNVSDMLLPHGYANYRSLILSL